MTLQLPAPWIVVEEGTHVPELSGEDGHVLIARVEHPTKLCASAWVHEDGVYVDAEGAPPGVLRWLLHRAEICAASEAPLDELDRLRAAEAEIGSPAASDPDAEFTARADRIEREIRRLETMPDEAFRTVALATLRAVWTAVDDLDRPVEKLHPADVVEKHLQRGNIVKDGQW